MQVFATSKATARGRAIAPQLTLKCRQAVRIMKLTGILLFAFCMQLSARGLTQTITLNVKDAPIQQVIHAIEKQTGYVFFYNNEMLKQAKRITIMANNLPLQQVLDLVFKDQPLVYRIVGKNIAIQEREVKKNLGEINKLAVPPIDVSGRVVNENGDPVAGVTVSIKGSKTITTTDNNGEFSLASVDPNAILVFTHVSLETFELKVSGKTALAINLKTKVSALGDVTVTVNTGYQQLPKERATGSFEHIDNELLSRRVSTNILDRLEGVASGVIFNQRRGLNNEPAIGIRGRSTIFANADPLIVIDNFPFSGDLASINPNDIENITILKDAAAASIWGARSGNGVIVLTTKSGKLSQRLKIGFNSNFTVGEKPDLFYDQNFLNSPDFIEAERYLFSKGFYDATLNNSTTRPIVSPVIELFAKMRAGLLTEAEVESQLSQFKLIDYRNDLTKHFYRKEILQQHSINFSGGGEKNTYYFAAGYDHGLRNLIGNEFERYTLNGRNSFSIFKGFQIATGINYANTKSVLNNSGLGTPGAGKSSYYPYSQLIDASGNALPLPKSYRSSYIDTTGSGNLLDWEYRPYDEFKIADNKTDMSDIRFNNTIKYEWLKAGLKAEIKYQFQKATTNNRNLRSQQTFFTRDLINQFTQVIGNTVTRRIPLGDILDISKSDLVAQSLRWQLNFDKTFQSHNINAIAGTEWNETKVDGTAFRFYGYDDNNASNINNLDYQTNIPIWQNLSASKMIPFNHMITGTTDEFISYFLNASYSYKKRYIFSFSGRIDQSNLFGVAANQKSVPLWSSGLAWNLGSEQFMKLKWLSHLILRGTIGYNGNIDKSTTAFTTAAYLLPNAFNLPTAGIRNPPNDSLRWEKVRIFNIAIDFVLKNKVLSGSIEYYHKSAVDLIGNIPTPPTSGMTSFSGNVADMKSNGVDIDLTSQNLNGKLKWTTNFLLSFVTDKVTNYKIKFSSLNLVQAGEGYLSQIIPVVGKPIYSVFSYKWAELDPLTGDPQGYLNKQISKDYSAIISNTTHDELIYHGSARPRVFGSIRNSFSLKNFLLSINILYKMNYYFRKPSINYTSFFNSWSANKDFSSRWQKAGDEQFTNVPSMIYPTNINRDNFYTYSSILVEKADHIRLQDIQLSYTIYKVGKVKLPFNNFQIFVYANNLGIIWKANNVGIDPDYVTGYINPKTFSAGVRATF